MYPNQERTLSLIPEEEFPHKILQVEKELSDLRREGYFVASGGAKIYYEYFLTRDPVGSVVFVHGLSEFTKKYYELAHYFLNQGYHVFLYDQRGHGRSHRDTDRPELIHINSFDQLAEDLNTYIETVVRPAASAPLYLYAHSMGGAVGLLYLSRYGQKLQKAVITSPLFLPRMNDLPPWPFLVSTGITQIFRGSTAKFLFSEEYEPGRPYTPVPGDSPNRVRYCLSHREREPMYRSTPMSLGCIHNCLKLPGLLLRKRVTEEIRIPTLMLCADTDTLVRTKYQGRFAKGCDACTHEILTGANHAFHTDCDEILQKALERILTFFSE
jgi:lysophospholipase